MKTRIGFVSNSSAASFCIYGWDDEYLRSATGESWNYESVIGMMEKLRSVYKIDIKDSNSPSAYVVFGVGNSYTEIDHGMDSKYECWEDYVSDPPSKEEMEKLDRIAKEMELPQPKMFSATWFDG